MSDHPRLRCQCRILAAVDDCPGLTPEQWIIIKEILRITVKKQGYTIAIQDVTPTVVAIAVRTVIAN